MAEKTPTEPVLTERHWRTQYGGRLGPYVTVESADGQCLVCFECGDDSLYHDAWCYWHEAGDDLLCPRCFAALDAERKALYERVVSQH